MFGINSDKIRDAFNTYELALQNLSSVPEDAVRWNKRQEMVEAFIQNLKLGFPGIFKK